MFRRERTYKLQDFLEAEEVFGYRYSGAAQITWWLADHRYPRSVRRDYNGRKCLPWRGDAQLVPEGIFVFRNKINADLPASPPWRPVNPGCGEQQGLDRKHKGGIGDLYGGHVSGLESFSTRDVG